MRIIPAIPDDDDTDLEDSMIFIGAVGMIDPPRSEVAESVRTCRRAGIRTVMITGDHKITALAIAKELGIYQDGSHIVSGDELAAMSDKQLDDVIENTSVFARVSPADKMRIICSLKRKGEVCCHDRRRSQRLACVKSRRYRCVYGHHRYRYSKEASDMILLDDSFTTIAYAIKEGRRVYRNIQKVIQFLLAGNIAEILTLFVATVLNWDAPLLAVHILWVNLATATLPSLALGVDPASRDIMDHPPVKSGTLFEKDLISRVITQGVFVAAMTIAAYWIGADLSGHQTGQTMAFCVLAFSQMLRAFNQRSNTQPIWVRAEGHNPWLILSFAVSLILMMCLLLIPALQDIFRLTSLSALQWAAVLILSCLSILQMEIVKLFKR